MRKINPFFLAGIIGILLTSIFHILMRSIFSEVATISSFSVLYPVFTIILLIGTGVMIKRKKSLKE